MRAAVYIFAVCFVVGHCEVIIKQKLDHGFLADLILHAPKALHGWRVHVLFSSPVNKIDIWDAHVVQKLNNGREFVIANKNYNKDLDAGDTIKMEIEAHTSLHTLPSASLYFEGFQPSGHSASSSPSSHVTTTPATPHHGNVNSNFNYTALLGDSILFYEAQRSGKLPSDNRIPWRGDSALGDKGDHGEDLTGGWYDAGDHMKFNFPMGASVTLLTWGMLKFKDAYVSSGQLDHMYSCIKWPLDYFLKCWEPSRQELYVQVGKGKTDHDVFGRAEDMTMPRPAYKVTAAHPGSDVAGQMAAAMAAGAIAFETKDKVYSTKLLTAAKSLYEFAKAHQGKYSDSVPDAKEFYGSSGFLDELALAAVWLYKASMEKHYLQDAENYVATDTAWALDWDDKNVAVQMLLYEVTKDNKYSTMVEAFLQDFMPGGTVPYTPCGLVFRDKWGPFSYAANAAMLALMAAENGLHPDSYRAWAEGQISYMLGDNKYHMSFVVGYGSKYPLHVHHSGSTCPNPPATCDWSNFDSPTPNAHVLYGALVGGPDAHDNYKDLRTDYIHNEVACDYNAGFQSAVSGLLHLKNRNQLPAPSLHGCT
ncbi:uncharacterized protein [Haliotis asinina]|uniref:uncharacterized protein n=1 Tax=Haliotis asinina TaxID=109174 RepID=UPI003531A86A